MFMIADAAHHFPGIAAVAASEQRSGFDSTPEIFFVVAWFDRPNVGQRAAVIFRKCRRGFGFLETLSEVGRAKHLHPEKSVATRTINSRRPTRIDQRGINRN